MEILELDAGQGRLIDRFDSRGAHVAVARVDGRAGISVTRLAGDGVLGRHPAIVDQLFYVVQGDGWVADHDRTRAPIRAGQAAHWIAGEEHESTSSAVLLRVPPAASITPQASAEGGRDLVAVQLGGFYGR